MRLGVAPFDSLCAWVWPFLTNNAPGCEPYAENRLFSWALQHSHYGVCERVRVRVVWCGVWCGVL